MKRFAMIFLSVFALSSIAAPTFAGEMNNNRQTTPTTETTDDNNSFGSQSTPTEDELEPVTLVQLAYQGYFEDQGIPSHAAFKSAIANGDIDAETLVRSAISKGRLSSDSMNDEGYLNIVRTQLENLNDR